MNKKLFSWLSVMIICLAILANLAAVAGQDPSSDPGPTSDDQARSGDPEPEWGIIESYTTTVQIDAGEKYYVYLDNENLELIAMPTAEIPTECQQAIGKVPAWMRDNLTYKFRQLPQSDQIKFANLIINAPDPKYVDEIAFSIAHTSVESLRHQYTLPQIFTDNAKYIYQNDQYLPYADIVEKTDYTTISYKNKTNVSRELPRDIYYWYVVHPKLSDELATYVDPDYDYSTQAPGDRNYGVSPPTGKFWREWLFYHNDTGQNVTYASNTSKSSYKPNPLLKELLSKCNTVWDAAKAVSTWVVDSMIFDSEPPGGERPIQPVRIYQEHMGRCGEHQDIAAAAARAGLIAAVCTVNAAEDHVWNEFWDEHWVHWDANSKNNIDKPYSHDKDYNGGKDISSVWNCRGDGYTWSVTSRYTPTCTFTASVLDSNGWPVDGAEIWAATENYYDPNFLTITTWGTSDHTGECTIELGNSRNYWSSADSEKLGEDPPDVGGNEQVTQVITNSVTNNNYPHTFNLQSAAKQLKARSATLPAAVSNKFKIDVSYRVDHNILQGINFNTREHYDLFGTSGNIDFFIADQENFTEYENGNWFDGFEVDRRANASGDNDDDISIICPTDDKWYMVLSNEFSQRTTKIVNFTVDLYGTLIAKVTAPMHDAKLHLDSTIMINGTAFSPFDLTGVEIDIDNENTWHAATDISGTGRDRDTGTLHSRSSSPWSAWEFAWDTAGLAPGEHNIRMRASDTKQTYITSLNVTLLDVTEPEIVIDQPISGSVFRLGEVLAISGIANDNVGVVNIELLIDGDRENITNITPSLFKGKWMYELHTADLTDGNHTITILAFDVANNQNTTSIEINLLEIINPVVQIIEPGNNSIQRLGDMITIKGSAIDNKEVVMLELIFDDLEPINITSELDQKKGAWSYEWNTSELNVKEGVHTIMARAYDAAYNLGTHIIKITLDGTPPVVAISTPVENAIFRAGDKISIQGTASDNTGLSTLEVIFDAEISKSIDITPNLLDGNWSYVNWTTYDLTSGTHNITVHVTDLLGHVGRASVFITIDAENPTVDILEINDPILIGNILAFQGTAADDVGVASLELLIGNMTYNITETYSSLNSTWSYISNTSEWTWIYDVTEGEYDIVIRVTDIVGKQTTEKITINFISYETDSDYDGMPDWWEMMYPRLDPNRIDGKYDFDKDGFTNLDEYLGADGLPGNDDYSDPTNKSSTPHRDEEGKSQNKADDYLLTAVGLAVVIILIVLLLMFLILKKRIAKPVEGATSEKAQVLSRSALQPTTKPTTMPIPMQMPSPHMTFPPPGMVPRPMQMPMSMPFQQPKQVRTMPIMRPPGFIVPTGPYQHSQKPQSQPRSHTQIAVMNTPKLALPPAGEIVDEERMAR